MLKCFANKGMLLRPFGGGSAGCGGAGGTIGPRLLGNGPLEKRRIQIKST